MNMRHLQILNVVNYLTAKELEYENKIY